MTTPLSSFKVYITPDVIPCPDPMIERELVHTVIEFCRETHLLQKEFNYNIDSDDIDSTSYHYSLDIDLTAYFTDLRPIMLIRVNIDGIDYTAKYREIIGLVENWDSIKEENVKYFFYPDNETIRFYDMNTTDTDMYIKMSVKPVDTVDTIDDLIYNDWLDTIVDGTKYRLLSMPNKSWSNPKAAALYYSTWRRGLSQAKLIGFKSYSYAPVDVNPRQFSYVMWD